MSFFHHLVVIQATFRRAEFFQLFTLHSSSPPPPPGIFPCDAYHVVYGKQALKGIVSVVWCIQLTVMIKQEERITIQGEASLRRRKAHFFLSDDLERS